MKQPFHRMSAAYLSSLKLTIMLLVLLALLAAAGTLIPQGQPLAYYRERLGGFPALVLSLLQLDRAYKSVVLRVLLALLAVNVIACTLERLRKRAARLGFLLMHLSLVFILAGAMINSLWGRAGLLELRLNQSASYCHDSRLNPIELPFDIALTDVEVRSRRSAGYLAAVDRFGNRGKCRLLAGERLELPGGAITVRKAGSGLRVKKRLVPAPDGKPGIAFALRNSEALAEGAVVEGAGFRGGRYGSVSLFLERPAGLAAAEKRVKHITDAVAAMQDKIKLTLAGGSRFLRFCPYTDVGRTFRLSSSDQTVRLLAYVPHFSLDTETGLVSSLSDEPVYPAVKVELSSPGRKAGTVLWLTAGRTVSGPDSSSGAADETQVTLTYLPSARMGMDRLWRIWILAQDTGLQKVVWTAPKQLKACVNQLSGRPPVSVRLSHSVMLDIIESIPRARLSRSLIRTSPEAFGAALTAEDSKGASKWLFIDSGSNKSDSAMGIKVVMIPGPSAYTSLKCRVALDNGHSAAKAFTLELNRPIRREGWTVYLNDVSESMGMKTAVLKVSRDPGLGLVYAGFLCLTFGTFWRFYFRPLIRRRAGRQRNSTGTSDAPPESDLTSQTQS